MSDKSETKIKSATIEAGSLRARIETASSTVVEKRSPTEILKRVLIRCENGRLSITATDLNRTYIAPLEGTADDGFECLLDANRIKKLLKSSKDLDLINLESDAHSVKLSSKIVNVTISEDQDTRDFPQLELLGAIREAETTFGLHVETIKRIFTKTLSCVSTEETRYYLNGVFFHIPEKSEEMRFVSTNGHILCRTAVPLDGEGEIVGLSDEGHIIPRDAVSDFLKVAGNRTAEGVVTVTCCDNGIAFEFEDGQMLMSKFIDATFPDYTRIYPRDISKEVVADPADIEKAIKIVSFVSDDRSPNVTLTSEKDVLTIECKFEGSSADSKVKAECDAGMLIGFNSSYLTTALKNIDGLAVIKSEDERSPAIIADSEDEETQFVIMPVRLSRVS